MLRVPEGEEKVEAKKEEGEEYMEMNNLANKIGEVEVEVKFREDEVEQIQTTTLSVTIAGSVDILLRNVT